MGDEKPMTRISIVGFVGIGAVLAGCGSSPSTEDTPPAQNVPKVSYVNKSEAGVGASYDVDPTALPKLYAKAASRYGSSRKDPFVLTKSEAEFETQQAGLRQFEALGGYETDYVPNPIPVVVPVIEQQPYRRLAGVVVGDSVLAIIEMGDGSEKIVRPGEKIPGTEWSVVSIDQEKAVLHRDGNVLPSDITVRLETPRPGTASYNTGGAGYPGPGGPGQGFGPGGGGRPRMNSGGGGPGSGAG